MNKTIILPEIAEAIATATGISNTESEIFVKDLFALIAEQLSTGDDVNIKGLGRFVRIDDDIVFSPDAEFADGVNLPFAAFEAIELDDDITDDILEKVHDDSNTQVVITNDTNSHADKPNAKPSNENNTASTIAPESESSVIDNTNDDTENSANTEPQQSEAALPDSQTEAIIVEPITSANPIDVIEIGVPAPIEPINTTEPKATEWKRIAIIIAFLIWGAICFIIGYIVAPNITIYGSPDATISVDSIMADDDTLLNMQAPSTPPDTIVSATKREQQPIEQAKVITDTVRANRFLTTMARQHYGLMDFWVYIYQENANILGNPNNINPGTVVIIPPATKYGIDPNNPESVKSAKLKATEIYAPYNK